MQLSGVFSVLPTPFSSTGEVDIESLRRVINLFLGAGINGVTVLGVTGEVARLNERELDEIASRKQGITVAKQKARSEANIPMGRFSAARRNLRAQSSSCFLTPRLISPARHFKWMAGKCGVFFERSEGKTTT